MKNIFLFILKLRFCFRGYCSFLGLPCPVRPELWADFALVSLLVWHLLLHCAARPAAVVTVILFAHTPAHTHPPGGPTSCARRDVVISNTVNARGPATASKDGHTFVLGVVWVHTRSCTKHVRMRACVRPRAHARAGAHSYKSLAQKSKKKRTLGGPHSTHTG